MKLVFLNIETKTPSWLKEAKEEYLKKLKAFHPTEEIQIKSPDLGREDREQKVLKEFEKIQKHLKPRDLIILLDERGEILDSIKFAQKFKKKIETSPERLVFVIGGAFGVSDDLKKKAQWMVNISPFTLNHWVAQLVVMEQVYRAQTILKNLPYHNV